MSFGDYLIGRSLTAETITGVMTNMEAKSELTRSALPTSCNRTEELRVKANPASPQMKRKIVMRLSANQVGMNKLLAGESCGKLRANKIPVPASGKAAQVA